MIRVTIAVPESKMRDANQFARALGRGVADERTYREPLWKDASGNLYSVSSGMVDDDFQTKAQGTLKAPNWKADMAAANRTKIDFVVADEVNKKALSHKVTAIVHENALEAVAILGLERV